MSQRMNYNAASPAGMKALGAVYGYVRQSGLPSRLVDLVFLRVSQINGCAYCIDMHSRDVLEARSRRARRFRRRPREGVLREARLAARRRSCTCGRPCFSKASF
jgi:AhpD family alkylhydroperoxidase